MDKTQYYIYAFGLFNVTFSALQAAHLYPYGCDQTVCVWSQLWPVELREHYNTVLYYIRTSHRNNGLQGILHIKSLYYYLLSMRLLLVYLMYVICSLKYKMIPQLLKCQWNTQTHALTLSTTGLQTLLLGHKVVLVSHTASIGEHLTGHDGWVVMITLDHSKTRPRIHLCLTGLYTRKHIYFLFSLFTI